MVGTGALGCIYDPYMEHTQSTHRAYMDHTWNTHGAHTEHTWSTYGAHMEHIGFWERQTSYSRVKAGEQSMETGTWRPYLGVGASSIPPQSFRKAFIHT